MRTQGHSRAVAAAAWPPVPRPRAFEMLGRDVDPGRFPQPQRADCGPSPYRPAISACSARGLRPEELFAAGRYSQRILAKLRGCGILELRMSLGKLAPYLLSFRQNKSQRGRERTWETPPRHRRWD